MRTFLFLLLCVTTTHGQNQSTSDMPEETVTGYTTNADSITGSSIADSATDITTIQNDTANNNNVSMETTEITSTNAISGSTKSDVTTTSTAEMTTTDLTTVPMTTIPPFIPLVPRNCSENCSAITNSGCNNVTQKCECNPGFILTNDSHCETVTFFQVQINVTKVQESTIQLEWNTMPFQNLEVLIQYDVMWYPEKSPSGNESTTASPFTITGLMAGELHNVSVRVNVTGRDGRKEEVNSNVIVVRTVPAQPSIISTTYDAPNVNVSWSISGLFERFVGLFNNSIAIDTIQTSAMFYNLSPATNYSLQLVTVSMSPDKKNSSELMYTFRTRSGVPGPPSQVNVSDIGRRNFTLLVGEPVIPNGKIKSYRFEIWKAFYKGIFQLHRNITQPISDSYMYMFSDNISPGAFYSVKVFAMNEDFESMKFTNVSFRTMEDVPGPVITSGVNGGDKKVNITWDRPKSPNGDIIAYRARIQLQSNSSVCHQRDFCVGECNATLLGIGDGRCQNTTAKNLTTNEKSVTWIQENLQVYAKYDVIITAYTKVGAGQSVNQSVMTTATTPTKVQNLNISVTGKKLTVGWKTPSPNPGPTYYIIVIRDTIRNRDVFGPFRTTALSYTTDTNLLYYWNYRVSVKAETDKGTSSEETRTFQTLPGDKLGNPRGERITILACDKVKIEWTEASYEYRNGPIDGYIFGFSKGGDIQRFSIGEPNYFATVSKDFETHLSLQELTHYELQVKPFSKQFPNLEGVASQLKLFTTSKCPENPAGQIAGIVIGFILLLVISLGIIFYIYRRKVKEIEQSHFRQNAPRLQPNTAIPVEEPIEKERPFLLAEAESVYDRKVADSCRLFSLEYGDIKKLSPKSSTDNANLDGNKAKNRYVNILSFDHSRVKLNLIDDDPTSDYINANFIPGYTYEREYIASQGPLPGTVNDFWRMTWEKSVTIIVMLTKCKEGNADKCEHYWPETSNEPKQYGDIVVNVVSVSNMDKFDINIFQVSQGDYTRTVKHFHFLEWPDFSADVDSTIVIDFIQTVRTHITPEVKGPVLVHCSAGVGRTGTYISVDYLMQFARDHDLNTEVDLFSWVLQMRAYRTSMVQVEKQYVFIHRALVDIIERKRKGLLQRNDESGITNEIVYENTAFESDDEEEEEDELFYENAKHAQNGQPQPLTEL